MVTLNEHYLELKQSYLFSEVARRASAFMAAHPEKDVTA